MRNAALWSTAAAVAARAGVPDIEFPTRPRERLAVTSWPFRSIMDVPGNRARDRSKKAVDVRDFAALVAERFDIHNINPLSSHFSSETPAYIASMRRSVKAAGSHITDLGLSGKRFYDPDPAVRRDAVEYGKKWIDIAVELGSPSVRQHVGRSPGEANVDLAAASLGEMASYASKKNIVVNLENDSPVAEDPFFLVAVIEKADNPNLRALPDFGNSLRPSFDADRNARGVSKMFQHVFNMCHVKDTIADKSGALHTIDLARMFAIAKRSGYRGYFCMEPDAGDDPFANTTALIRRTLEFLS